MSDHQLFCFRDNYDKKVKASKGQEKRPLLVSSNKPKKPEQRHYVPPSHRDSSSQQQAAQKKQHLFKFVYEDQHGECHHLDVFKDDNARDLARQFGHNLSLSVPMTQALEDFLETHVRDKEAALKNNGTS
ncbi:hypothetical protein NP493_3551g00001 [Ridgeia piscesae]|uniref:Uncharacterized protein n=1 Tax=Ridgeia piscesae TaxID=27915 RepID=A0AAD9J6B7_RIDPI|nr:hypothetical protein NP493_3551g00001 [Ridgeia piscesae]